METLVVAAHHRDQYHSRSGRNCYGSIGSPSRDFREINCRTFQSCSSKLPTLLKASSPPVVKQSFSNSPKTPSPSPPVINQRIHSDQNPKRNKRIIKNNSVPISVKIKHVDDSIKQNVRGSLNHELFYSELWAGPAYSNSPPPSSLPIPKFMMKPMRTVSLSLPSVSDSDIVLLPTSAKSAPPSPSREHHTSQRNLFNRDYDSATNTLRRILNLDLID